MLSVPDIFFPGNYTTFGNISCFLFFLFSWGKKWKTCGNKTFDKKATHQILRIVFPMGFREWRLFL